MRTNHFKRCCSLYAITPSQDTDGFFREVPTKIGVAKSPERRVKTLQTGNPSNLIIADAFEFEDRDTALSIESAMHGIFSDFNLTGEWFLLSRESYLVALSQILPEMIGSEQAYSILGIPES